jgi:cytochrome c biogenesis protein CcmG, thiol:disulfide interchange protein DsbE
MLRFLSYAVPLLVFVGIATLALVGLNNDDRSDLQSAMLGKPIPEFSLPGPVASAPGLASSDLRQGTVTLVNIFASWCAPCRVEHPQLEALARQHGVVVHAIAYKDKPQDTMAFLQELGNPFTRIGMDTQGRVAIDWGVYGVPETFVVRGDGIIMYRHVGDLRPEHVTKTILPLVRDLQAQAKS